MEQIKRTKDFSKFGKLVKLFFFRRHLEGQQIEKRRIRESVESRHLNLKVKMVYVLTENDHLVLSKGSITVRLTP